MLKSLVIENFRALEDFRVSKLGRVNLIVGKNNSGKSSILEALRIYAGAAQYELLQELAGSHDELADGNDANYQEALAFEAFFPGRQLPTDKRAILIGEIDHPENRLQIRHAQTIVERIQDQDGQTIHVKRRVLDDSEELSTLEGVVEQMLMVRKGALVAVPLIPRRFVPSTLLLPCAVVPSRSISFDELADIWDKVGLTNGKAIVLEAMRIIAPDFIDLMFVNTSNVGTPKSASRRSQRSAIVSLQNHDRPVPLNSMGDGMSRILQIILKVFAAQGGMLLIDEFENGLHYSVQEKVWQMIFELAQKLDIQVFATTHSWDCIESFAQVARQRQADDGILFRVGRSIRTSDHGKIIATLFDGEQLFGLTQAQMEVR